jgi:hypothetical protein
LPNPHVARQRIAKPSENLHFGARVNCKNSCSLVTKFVVNDCALLREALENKWDVGYQRCDALLRDLLPGIAPEFVDHRLSLVGIYGNTALATWEARRDSGEPGRLWAPGFAVSNLRGTFEGMLVAEPSQETRPLLNESRSNRETAR